VREGRAALILNMTGSFLFCVKSACRFEKLLFGFDLGFEFLGNPLGPFGHLSVGLIGFGLEIDSGRGNDFAVCVVNGNGYVVDFLSVLPFFFHEGLIGFHGAELVFIALLTNAFSLVGGDSHALGFARRSGSELQAHEFRVDGKSFLDELLSVDS
jgi:hypothetical protein